MKSVDIVDCINKIKEENERYGIQESNEDILENATYEFNKIVKFAKIIRYFENKML